jgi:hypothetical protein
MNTLKSVSCIHGWNLKKYMERTSCTQKKQFKFFNRLPESRPENT